MSDRHEMPVTEERRRIFLDTLRRTGSFKAACRASTPHGKAPAFGSSTWHDLRKSDMQFAKDVEEALSDFLGRAEEVYTQRGFEPERKKHYARDGSLISEEVSYREANKALRAVLARHDSDWAERRTIDKNVQVSGGLMHFQLQPNDVLLLDEPEQAELLRLLEKIADRKVVTDGSEKLPE